MSRSLPEKCQIPADKNPSDIFREVYGATEWYACPLNNEPVSDENASQGMGWFVVKVGNAWYPFHVRLAVLRNRAVQEIWCYEEAKLSAADGKQAALEWIEREAEINLLVAEHILREDPTDTDMRQQAKRCVEIIETVGIIRRANNLAEAKG